ncbi:MAG: hypothetical protein ACLT74_11685 [Christensenellales bacterium]
MGTTLSVLRMSDNFVYIGHVGDSRVYLLRDGEFKQLTLDHSGGAAGARRRADGGRGAESPDAQHHHPRDWHG